MKTLLHTLFFLLLATKISFAQLEFFNEDQVQKISSEKITAALDLNLDSLRLDSIITAYMNSENIPGAATLITKNNEVIWNKNYGYRNLEYQLPVEDSTLFLIASISKTILATAIMQLWENGMIDLESNINDYLPSGFTVINPYFPNSTITVKMLMTHTSSLQDDQNVLLDLYGCGDYPVPFDSFLVNYFTPGGAYYSLNNFHNYPPGGQWDYSNFGSCLLALMVEHLTGKSFNDYTRDSIFIPLSMNSSSWFLQGLDTSKIAVPYVGQPPFPLCHQGFAYWPIGQLRTNKFELSNFASAYLNNGIYNNYRLLDSSTISLMICDNIPGHHTAGGGKQGLIWFTDPGIYDNAWGHTGGWLGCETALFVCKEEKWIIIFFNNYSLSSNWPPPKMAQYAHLYGNIYAHTPFLDKTYARKNIDSVLFRTRFTNIFNHTFTSYLIYGNPDSTQSDSLALYDDGLHGDSLSDDGIYGAQILPQHSEDFYSLEVSTIDGQTNNYFITPDLGEFTTAGPVTLDSIRYVKDIFNFYNLKPFVTNRGEETTITNAKIKLLCNDPWVLGLGDIPMNLPPIAPGETVAGASWVVIEYNDTAFPGYFNIEAEISRDGFILWRSDLIHLVVGMEEEQSQAVSFSLGQNYPNPFNPTTIINWQLPFGCHITLKVYDILGREVMTLVNEYRQAGKYETEFNAENLPSGVYFYRIKAGDFLQTKKMILLK